MASREQQQQFVEFVEAVKRKRTRNLHHYLDTSTTPIRSNYGNKLKRGADYVSEGKLDVPKGSSSYAQEIDYNGYRRRIISRNPLKFDDYGDVVDAEDELEDGEGAPLEDNVYEGIKIEDLLKPLTSAAELAIHPSMSYVYKEPGLPEMIRNAELALHKEQQLLWTLKELFTKFRGDSDWAPVGEMNTDYDQWLLASATKGTAIGQHKQEDGDTAAPALGWDGQVDGAREDGLPEGEQLANGADVDMTDASNTGLDATESTTEGPHISGPGTTSGMYTNGAAGPRTNGSTTEAGANGNSASTPAESAAVQEPEDAEMADPASPEHRRMTTRALASIANVPSRSPSPPPIHPFFLPPPNLASNPEPANPDEDPLPPLLSYISKQEEIVRLQNELYHGLLKALRMRENVMRWCKAEGHVGEMSDGEDWVDLDEWGLEEGQLVKGKEEDDNDNNHHAGEGGPSRRGRRGGRGGGAAGASGERG